MFEKYDAYKDSGDKWIGEIPTDWFNERLGTILEPISIKGNADKDLLSITREKGVILRDVEDDSENHNFIPDDLSNYKLIKKGQFGMNKMKAWQGSYGVSPYTGIVSPAYYIFRFIKPIYPDFFHWAIRSKTYISFFGSASDGVRIGQWDLSKDRMKNIPFVFPDIDSQKKIVEFIKDKAGKIDQAIAIKEQQITLLNERKQIVIQKAVTQGLDPNVPMKDSGVEWIGQIPEHWNIKKLKFICKSQGRIGFKGYSSDDLVEPHEGALTLGATHLNWNGEIILDQPVYLNWKKYYESPEIMVKKDDILIVQRGSTCGKVAIVDKDYGAVTINPSLVLLKQFRENPYFFVESIKVVLNGILNEVSKTAIPMISQFQINNIQIALPPIEEQVLIVKKVQEVTAQYSEINKLILDEIIRLKEYKTTLINDAVTGKIKVA